MKPRMYNNYDGYMYTVHNLSLGDLVYKGNSYSLDDELDRNKIVYLLIKDGVLKMKVRGNHSYYEEVYLIQEHLLHKTFREDSIENTYLQIKATVLNLKEIYNRNCICLYIS